jgi:MOSC domain-containing protein YiiM
MVEAIHFGNEGEPQLRPVRSASAVAGKGLEGDRHFHPEGAAPGQAITLVEAEEVERAGLASGQTRRQVTVRGVRLNELVGRRFRVGTVECYGVELCEPCLHLQSLTRPGIIEDLVHRAGINADILSDGVISVGDAVVATDV